MTKVLDNEYREPVETTYNIRTAMEEASRCLLCYDAPCSTDCPAGTDPGKFIRSIRFRNVKGAAETIRENNPLGGSCSLICPHDKLCEAACSRTGIDKPINIGKLQEFAVQQEKLFDMEINKPVPTNGKKVACIGSGPASLSCASVLAREGYEVTVFEENEKPGGVLTYGINPSRISQELVDYDIELIENQGVKIVCNKKIEESEIKDLLKEYDAVHVGIGLGDSVVLNDEEIDLSLDGVETALEFLKNAREGKIETLEGERVVIIGGGDVAMDCSITAKQLGADTRIVYRRSIEEAPANVAELEIVQKMGIPIDTGFAPRKTYGENGKIVGLEFGPFNSEDKFAELKLPVDRFILALGQKIESDYSDFMQAENIFASGDVVNGGETVVQAVKEGKEIAMEIIEYISKKEEK